MQMKNIRKIRREIADKKAILRCAEEFNMAGDPTRLKICYLLCRHKELSVGEIADVLGVSISAVSHALTRLKSLEMVSSRRSRKQVFYALAKNTFVALLRKSLRAV